MERLGHELDEDDFNNFVEQLISQLNVYCSGGSGWVVETLLAVEVKVAAPVRESGSSFIPTPAILRGLTRSILNVKNKKDEMCFLYLVLAALYPLKSTVTDLLPILTCLTKWNTECKTFRCVSVKYALRNGMMFPLQFIASIMIGYPMFAILKTEPVEKILSYFC